MKIDFYIQVNASTLNSNAFMVFSSKDENKIQEFVTERAYPVSLMIIIMLMFMYRDMFGPFVLKSLFPKCCRVICMTTLY